MQLNESLWEWRVFNHLPDDLENRLNHFPNESYTFSDIYYLFPDEKYEIKYRNNFSFEVRRLEKSEDGFELWTNLFSKGFLIHKKELGILKELNKTLYELCPDPVPYFKKLEDIMLKLDIKVSKLSIFKSKKKYYVSNKMTVEITHSKWKDISFDSLCIEGNGLNEIKDALLTYDLQSLKEDYGNVSYNQLCRKLNASKPVG